MELDEVLSGIAGDGIEFVRFEQTDLHGISRSKTIPAKHVESFARNGLNFLLGQLGFDAQAGVAPGTGYLEDRGFPDSKLFPDTDTYAVLPWADSTARLICNPHFFDGAPAGASPRLVMGRLCDALADEGYHHLAGYEYEVYLVRAEDRQPPFEGIQIFATLRNNFDDAFIRRILRSMPAVGVDVITANAEYGPGQDDTTPGRLSEVGRWWVGGQLAHLPALTAFFAPTVNCGKRFKQWSFAPVNVSLVPAQTVA